jgi:hypothetical protein
MKGIEIISEVAAVLKNRDMKPQREAEVEHHTL